MLRRVVITGLGIVCPLGAGVQPVWTRLIAGKSGVRSITEFDTDDLNCKIAGLIPEGSRDEGLYDPDWALAAKDRRKMDRMIHLALTAAKEALEDADFVADSEAKAERAGVMVGSGIGGMIELYESSVILHEKGARRMSPFMVPSTIINMASGHISIRNNLKGPNHACVTACATGTHAVGDAARMIALGDADLMVAGGTESAVCRLGMGGFAAARALSSGYNDQPEQASRPWDKGRDGFVMGDGAGMLILESLEHAQARGARIYAEIIGYGMSADAHHMTAPSPDGSGARRAMQAALARANLQAADIDYLNAHGTSTPAGDMVEIKAVKALFGDAVAGLSVSSTKSAIGHLLGAAGAVEAIFTTLALHNQIAPPTLNLTDPEEGTEGMDLVPLVAKKRDIQVAMSNSFGFGGTNASLVMKRPDEA